MPYDSIPHVGATYLDGALTIPTITTQPRILVMGPADSGMTYELFAIRNVCQAETEFGSGTEVMKGVHEAIAQGADNLAVMRIGGTQGSMTITDSLGGTLTITPEYRDASILDRYSLVIEQDGTTNRIGIYDIINEVWIYDSEEILVINEGIIEVVDTGLTLVDTNLGTFNNPTPALALSGLLTSSFTVLVAGTTILSATPVPGTDGSAMSLVERYAALNTGYHLLDFTDTDYVVPTGVYVDDPNVVDSGAVANFFKGVPSVGSATDELGYVWQYIYQGKLYTYFTDTSDYFSVARVAATVTLTNNTDITLTAQKTGVGGNSISIVITDTGGLGLDIDIDEPTATTLLISVNLGGSGVTEAALVTALNIALDNEVLSNGDAAGDLVQASGSGAGVAVADALTPLLLGAGGHAFTHADLTGDTVPAAVTAKWAVGEDVQLRECNFAHQLATFCRLSSKVWKTTMGSISFKLPTAFSRQLIANWIGQLPTYTQVGLDMAIGSVGVNGTGLLGNKFMAGKYSYRTGMVSEAVSNEGFAYGGFIQTKGSSLPNGTEWAYGISDSDELVDEGGFPVDLGKHLFVTYDWPVHRNAYNNGTPYRGALNVSLLGKLAILPENEEPIGDNGVIVKIASPPKIHSTQKDGLAEIRAIGLRLETGLGYIFVSAKTAAHPSSDYIRSSTIRCVNRELDGLREISKGYLGKPFNPQSLVSLQSDIDQFLAAERSLGFNQGARASIRYTPSDRILGRLEIRMQMVPPFSIESIDITMSLAADESELS